VVAAEEDEIGPWSEAKDLLDGGMDALGRTEFRLDVGVRKVDESESGRASGVSFGGHDGQPKRRPGGQHVATGDVHDDVSLRGER
jgi:hypothetical protein